MEDTRCEQKGCESPAAWSFVWPGQASRQLVCQKHGEQAADISRALGIGLAMEWIGPWVPIYEAEAGGG